MSRVSWDPTTTTRMTDIRSNAIHQLFHQAIFYQSCLLSELLRMEIEEIYSTAGNRHKNTILDIQSSKLTFFLICKTSSAGSCKWESLKKIFHILHRSMKYVKTNHVNICPHSEDCLLPARTVSDI